jgi:predicted lipoprotein with Yx(FWY)xxD motif
MRLVIKILALPEGEVMKNVCLVILGLMVSGVQAVPLTTVKLVKEVEDGKVKIERLLQDSQRRALYKFDMDSNGKSNCSAKCAEIWAPYVITEDEMKTLVQAPLGTIVRDSGTIQLTYEGSPLYYYFQDRTRNDFKGDGVGGVWHYIEIDN